jgi:hypothetical protein
MDVRSADTGMHAVLDGLRIHACREHGVPERTAREAAAVTARRLSGVADPRVEADRRRVRAYFWGVVRRRSLAGGPGTGRYGSMCVAATLAAGMRAAGHPPDAIRDLAADFGVDAAGLLVRASSGSASNRA